EPCRFLRDVLPILFAEAKLEAPADIPAERAQAKWAAGVPLLRGESVAPDPGFADRWKQVCAATGQPAAAEVAGAVQRGAFDARELIAASLNGRADSIHARAGDLGLDAALTTTVLRLTLLPQFAIISAHWATPFDNCRWDQGYCPICGS